MLIFIVLSIIYLRLCKLLVLIRGKSIEVTYLNSGCCDLDAVQTYSLKYFISVHPTTLFNVSIVT